MSQTNFRAPTPEERAEYQEKARLKKLAQKEAAKNFQTPNPADYQIWKELSAKYGFKMPNWYTPVNQKYMCRYLRKLKLGMDDCRELFGDSWQLSDFSKLNPNKSLAYFVGALLEYKDENEQKNRN